MRKYRACGNAWSFVLVCYRSVPVYRSMVLPVRNLAVFMRVPHDLLYFSTLYMLLYLLAEIFVPAIYPTAALTIIFYGC